MFVLKNMRVKKCEKSVLKKISAKNTKNLC